MAHELPVVHGVLVAGCSFVGRMLFTCAHVPLQPQPSLNPRPQAGVVRNALEAAPSAPGGEVAAAARALALGFRIPDSVPAHSWIKRKIGAPPNRYGLKPGRHWCAQLLRHCCVLLRFALSFRSLANEARTGRSPAIPYVVYLSKAYLC